MDRVMCVTSELRNNNEPRQMARQAFAFLSQTSLSFQFWSIASLVTINLKRDLQCHVSWENYFDYWRMII